MTVLWIVAGLALAVAVLAYVSARRTARRVTQVTEMYWQLKYDHGELKARVAPVLPVPAGRPEVDPQQTFVPLSQVKGSARPPKP